MNEKQPYYYDELIIRSLSGEADAADVAALEKWLQQDPANRKHFEQFSKIWTESRQLAAVSTVDEEAAWTRFRERVAAAPKAQRFGNGWRIAATLLLGIGLAIAAWMGYQKFSSVEKNIAWSVGNSTGKRQLPDGSTVVLNKNSRIDYPETFHGTERKIALEGEAFFDIHPDKAFPFSIKVGKTTVTVLGTSFNIRQTEGKTEIIVATGLVRVSNAGKSIDLKPNEKAIVTDSSAAISIETEKEKLYKYYSSRSFVCDDTPLWKLVEVLERAYGTRIDIRNPDLRNLRLNTTFNEEPLENIIRIITETFNIKASRESDRYVLE